MALTRRELKQVVKGLLLEILSEGLGSIPAAPDAPSRIASTSESRRTRPPYDPALDAPVRRPAQDSLIREAIKRNSGGNAVMADILADTAATTLATLSSDKQLGQVGMPEGGGSSQGISQVEQINGSPEEVFGEGVTSRWANLAFTDPKKPL